MALVNVPIFDGGLIRSHIDQAQAAVRAALAQQRQIELINQRDSGGRAIALSWTRRIKSRFCASPRQTADDAFALAWTRFLGGGNITLLEVITAYQQAENLRLAIYDQEFTARQATAQARRFSGCRNEAARRTSSAIARVAVLLVLIALTSAPAAPTPSDEAPRPGADDGGNWRTASDRTDRRAKNGCSAKPSRCAI